MVRVKGSRLPRASRITSHRTPAATNRRTTIGPRPTCMKAVTITANMASAGTRMRGRAEGPMGRKLAPTSSPSSATSASHARTNLPIAVGRASFLLKGWARGRFLLEGCQDVSPPYGAAGARGMDVNLHQEERTAPYQLCTCKLNDLSAAHLRRKGGGLRTSS